MAPDRGWQFRLSWQILCKGWEIHQEGALEKETRSEAKPGASSQRAEWDGRGMRLIEAGPDCDAQEMGSWGRVQFWCQDPS